MELDQRGGTTGSTLKIVSEQQSGRQPDVIITITSS